jgi:hypothetical protein
MALAEPPEEQPPEQQPRQQDTALLIALLNHYWARYDGRRNRAFQVLNYYLVAAAILFTAYTTAINGKHYTVAIALAIAGLGLTAITAATVLFEIKAADLARPAVDDMQKAIAAMLAGVNPQHMKTFEAGKTRNRRRLANVLTFLLAAALNISALIYAVIH